jgi:hypothetical protein
MTNRPNVTTQPDQPKLPYLAIKNWGKFQPKSRNGKPFTWLADAVRPRLR